MSTHLIILLVFGVWLVLGLLGGLVVARLLAVRRGREAQALAAGAARDADGATELPVRGTYSRAGFLQGGYAKNSINPRFWVGRDGVRIRILKTWHLPFAELLQIDARKTMTGVALIFQVAAANRAFVVRFGDPQLARTALALVPPTVPLTEEAACLRDGDSRAATPGLRRYRGPFN